MLRYQVNNALYKTYSIQNKLFQGLVQRSQSALASVNLNLPPTEISVLDNGMRVATEDSGVPTATVGLWIDTGSRYETAANNGMSMM